MVESKYNYEDLPIYAQEFLLYNKTILSRSVKTVDEYYLDLRTYFRYIKNYKKLTDEIEFEKIYIADLSIDTLESISLQDIYLYLNYVLENRKNDTNTRARKISSLKSFYKYMCDKVMLMEYNPTVNLEPPKIKKSLPKHLNVEQSIALLESITGLNKQRDYAMIILLLNCGLRVSELVGININDISNTKIRIIGKGNKERILHLNETCINAIEDYKKVRLKLSDVEENRALFVTREKNRISVSMVQKIIEKYLKLSGLSLYGFSTHKLRHTAATLMYQNGADLRTLQEILGHSSLQTTQIYTHLNDKNVENVMNNNPLNKIKKRKKDDKKTIDE